MFNQLSYIVDGKVKFSNRWQALHYATKNNTKDVKFDIFNDTFRQIDWTKDPELSWETLCDMRSIQLANSNRPLVLFWSGGTDSYTVYQSLIRTNTKISAFFIKTRNDEDLVNNSIHWLKKNHSDKSTEFIIVDNDEILKNTYTDNYFLFETATFSNFSISSPDRYSINLIKTKYPDAILLTGFEKPRLFLENGLWYSSVVDLTFEACMPPNDIEMFYITPDLPELHVKQSWLLKKWLENSGIELTDQFVTHDVHNPVKFDYNTFARACGRVGDLSHSNLQKLWNHRSDLILDINDITKSVVLGRGERLFKERMLDRDSTVMNFLLARRTLLEKGTFDSYWLKNGKPIGILSEKFYMGKTQCWN